MTTTPVIRRPLTKKPPAKRLFSGMVGAPYEPEETPAAVAVMDHCVPTYETEIKKALGHSSISRLRQSALRQKDYEDLRHTIDIEILQACEHYQDRMTPALAYAIAWNHVTKFIKQRIEQPKSLSLDDKPEGKENKELSSQAELLVNEHATEGVRTWGFDESFDNSYRSMENPAGWIQVCEETLLLEKLIKTYDGTKRQVAEAMLYDPDLTIRDVAERTGVPRSTISRHVQAIRSDLQTLPLTRPFLKFLEGRGLTIQQAQALPADKQQELRRSFYMKTKDLQNT